ncbi:hypothetical protein [Mangrovicella endophytica]|uniref:hypothetical protein n=1 Tax=Mangrovicella endophytica TaxID=2066697 RepID=UPI000C9E84CB|nr:hypothetical protein [Mangrovicella endophytica]
MKRWSAATVLTAAVLTAQPLAAQESAGAAPSAPVNGSSERYQVAPTDGGGIARVDKQTGTVSICAVSGTGMSCQPSRDEAAALRAEIEKLQARVDKLEARARERETAEQAEAPKTLDQTIDEMKRVFRAFGDAAREFRRDLAEPDEGPMPDRT